MQITLGLAHGQLWGQVSQQCDRGNMNARPDSQDAAAASSGLSAALVCVRAGQWLMKLSLGSPAEVTEVNCGDLT